jgi:hypothetical protein
MEPLERLQRDKSITSSFMDKAREIFGFLVEKHSFQLVSANEYLGGREATITYLKGAVRVVVSYEVTSGPWVVVRHMKLQKSYTLERLFKSSFRERYTRIYDAWYGSKRFSPAITPVLQENADFLQNEGCVLLSEGSWKEESDIFPPCPGPTGL